MRRSLVTLSTLLLGGCALLGSDAPPPAPDPAPGASSLHARVETARQAAAEDGATMFAVDAEASDVRIHVFRGGRAPRLGKNHVIAVRGLKGFVALDSDLPVDAGFTLAFRLDALDLDPDALRTETGGSFGKLLSEDQIEGTRNNMLSADVLDAERFPEVMLSAIRMRGDWPMLVARTAVTLHGTTVEYDTLMRVTREDDRLIAEGSMVIRQTDFGITPMTTLGGILGLQDPLGITYRLVARGA
ncbi:YceI family protein [Algiphilus sp.]|uniref:YceI family protein n=1 Tax=Algiphilus sp. TaxID=1872431 RepID=UPI0025C1438D|nr:YceI family protein [Algiphilus sp.]MCK5769129.1 YceI family protein [Algiphilus sp.]